LHLNLIRHGRGVCKARRPLCSKCDLQELCDWYQTHDAAEGREG
jgi:endonuclease-3